MDDKSKTEYLFTTPIITLESRLTPVGTGCGVHVKYDMVSVLNEVFDTDLTCEGVSEIFKEAIESMSKCNIKLMDVLMQNTPQEEAEKKQSLYNGKIFCADSNHPFFEKGKIYAVKDGDLNIKETFCGTFASFDQIVSHYKGRATFIEVKE